MKTVIERPIITEKSLKLAESATYCFAVNNNANKTEIGQAIEKLYGVKVKAVRVANQKGKVVRRRTGLGKENDWQKAYVSLEKGQKIKEFEFPVEKESKGKGKEAKAK